MNTEPDTIICPAWDLEPMEDKLPASWRRPMTKPCRIVRREFPWALLWSIVIVIEAVVIALEFLS